MLLPTMLNAVKIGKKTLVINMMTKVFVFVKLI